VRQAVRKHLRTPTFGPTVLCRLVGISRSNLYNLFEDSGGVARYIQRERLIEAHAMLTDPATTRSVSAIAEDLSLLTLPASAALSNGSSAPATCGRRRVLGWRSRCRRESSPCRWEETLASSFADPSRARGLANDIRSADRADVRIAGGRV
jgi:hypothetical protein